MADTILWTDYATQKPPKAGIYRWRLKSKAVDGLVVQFSAKNRVRGAGYADVLSPEFDYWDGYRVHVPACEWSPETNNQIPGCLGEFTTIEGLHLLPCPDCGKVPEWQGVQEAMGGGCYVGAHPHEYNVWWLQCCMWQLDQHIANPAELAKRHNQRAVSARLYEALCDMVSDHECLSEGTLKFARETLALARGEARDG